MKHLSLAAVFVLVTHHAFGMQQQWWLSAQSQAQPPETPYYLAPAYPPGPPSQGQSVSWINAPGYPPQSLAPYVSAHALQLTSTHASSPAQPPAVPYYIGATPQPARRLDWSSPSGYQPQNLAPCISASRLRARSTSSVSSVDSTSSVEVDPKPKKSWWKRLKSQKLWKTQKDKDSATVNGLRACGFGVSNKKDLRALRACGFGV